MQVEQRMAELGLKPGALVHRTNRVAALQHGDLVYLSGRTRGVRRREQGQRQGWAAT